MYQLFRSLLFRLPPERAHGLTIALLRAAGAFAPGRAALRALLAPRAGTPVDAFGLRFANAVGLAAGYDKDALGWRGLAALGFGHLELGTVTPKAQPGNPGPRVFRLVDDRAVINRMGFPGRGADFVAQRLRSRRPGGPIIGVNIGKNKATPNEEAAADYVSLMRTFAPLAGYLAVNVSSPNTPGLRSLQTRAALGGLLGELARERAQLVSSLGRPVPLLVKLAPDLADAELDDALAAALDSGVDGLIISNTTVGRAGLTTDLRAETGGLSGAPLRSLNTRLVREAVRRTSGRLPVIASGGVMKPDDAAEKLDAGATLVQLYSGLIFAGPGLVRGCVERLATKAA